MANWRNGIELNFQGIELAEKLSLRTHLLLISLWLFLWNINDAVLVQAIGKLPLPEKLIQLFVLTVRYIALPWRTASKNGYCHARLVDFVLGLIAEPLYVTAQSVALLLIHALLKAETAQMALKCRGFSVWQKERKITC
ncbi:cobalt transport protein [Haemophilus influenzae]|uniref:Cobalt transport protein n=1 Tax=Haemophilus influenzae TaxID=727 RepID=A0A2X1PTD7_HAEIF|nr:cobalt transport protein [Haemophilus influenzae]